MENNVVEPGVVKIVALKSATLLKPVYVLDIS